MPSHREARLMVVVFLIVINKQVEDLLSCIYELNFVSC